MATSANNTPKILSHYVQNGVKPSVLCCLKCKKFTESYHEPRDFGRVCLKLSCTMPGCENGNRSWYVCLICKNKRFARQKPFQNHFNKVHNNEHKRKLAASSSGDENNASKSHTFEQGVIKAARTLRNTIDEVRIDSSREKKDTIGGRDQSLSEKDENQDKKSENGKGEILVYPKRKDVSQISSLFHDTGVASIQELQQSLSDLEAILYFWSAEHATPGEFHAGGGLQYMVSRALNDSELIPKVMPTFFEAKWHFTNFIQYNSMTNGQRRRQAELTRALLTSGVDFFKTTRIPAGDDDLRRLYGRSHSNSMWNTLPVPPIQQIGDIAYVNPVHIIRFFFANGLEFDPVMVFPNAKTCDSDLDIGGGTRKVFHIHESEVIRGIKKKVIMKNNENATTNNINEHDNNNETVEPKVIVWCCDWRDGFGTGRTKNNRKSVIAWTLTIAPPKDRVNTTDNTFPIAMGLGKSKFWPEVEHRYRKDTECFGQPEKPLRVLHGPTKKILPILPWRIVSLEDKPERDAVLQTRGNTGTYSRLFGKAIRIDTAPCFSNQVAQFLQDQRLGMCDNDIRAGWSAAFIDRESANGGRLQSCVSCRQKRLEKLGVIPKAEQEEMNGGGCLVCADFEINESTKNILMFPASKQYPKKSVTPCPVEAPPGREVGCSHLHYVDLTWDFMKQACRFAFANIVHSQQNRRWNQTTLDLYLATCGVNKAVAKELYKHAQSILKNKSQENIDYQSPHGIGGMEFPAAWSGDLPIDAYIELMMHELYLGIAKSNMSLVDDFLKFSKLGETTFKKNANELLSYLRFFQLSWLPTFPYSPAGETGGWVSENFSAFVRVSKILVGWCLTDPVQHPRLGALDLCRMVVAFQVACSRIMTHSGLDDNDIDQIDLFIKEFLSCVAEFDIQVRHAQMKKKTVVSDRLDIEDQDGANKEARPMPGHEEDTNTTEERTPKNKAKQKKQNGKKTKATATTKLADTYWAKSNYVSLLNIVPALRKYGPMVNLYDGGGKGEKNIPEYRALLPPGLREGIGQHFVTIVDKVYKNRQISYMEKFHGLQPNTDGDDVESDDLDKDGLDYFLDENGVMCSTDMLEQVTQNPVDSLIDNNDRLANDYEDDDTDEIGEDNDDDDEATESDRKGTENDDNITTSMFRQYSKVEDQQMSKTRTFYVYRRRAIFENAWNQNCPISGILVGGGTMDSMLSPYVVFRLPGKSFGWLKLEFADQSGHQFCGHWWAPVQFKEVDGLPTKYKDIQLLAKMSFVAIPLRYVLEGKPNSAHYCVITNWWKDRSSDGQYQHPVLDSSLYPGGVISKGFVNSMTTNPSSSWVVGGELNALIVGTTQKDGDVHHQKDTQQQSAII